MVTREQSMLNARTAAAVIARGYGFYQNIGAGFRMGSLSREDQVKLGDGVAAYVAARPHLFTSQALDAARYHLSLPLTGKPLFDESLSLSAFSDAFLDEVRVTLPAIGNRLLIAAVVVAAVYFAVRAWRVAPAR